MSNKQSSVEWLKDQLEHFGNKHELQVSWTTVDELFEQAKEMHKEELKKCAETFEVCYYDGIHNGTTFNEYYNEMYGDNNGTK